MSLDRHQREIHASELQRRAEERTKVQVNAYPEIDIVLLSGSARSGNVTKYSDIDLDVLSEEPVINHSGGIVNDKVILEESNTTWYQIEPMLSNPASELFVLLLDTYKSADILYARNDEIKQRYEKMVNPVVDDEVKEQMREYSLSKGLELFLNF